MKTFYTLLFIIAASLFIGCKDPKNDIDPDISTPHVDRTVQPIAITMLSEYKHDTSAFTQGLEFYDGKLYESTGDYAASSLRITDAKTGAVIQKHMMGSESVFGEGITIFRDQLFQLTWQNNEVYVYNVNNIKKSIRKISWPYEGWGITHNDSSLYISDGSANIYMVNPQNLKVQNVIGVTDASGALQYINELEYVDGFIYANIYLTNRIVKIDAATGHVVGDFKIDNIMNQQQTADGLVLNGIAYNPDSKTFFVTGKKWPKMYEIKLN